MAFIEESVISGFIGKVISDCVDVSWKKIKEADKNKGNKYQNAESQIYNVVVCVLNQMTYNKYVNDQDKVYQAAEKILLGYRNIKYDSIEVVEAGLQVLGELVNDDKYMEFKRSLYQKISKNDYVELYREIGLSQHDEERRKTSRIEKKVGNLEYGIRVANEKLDSLKRGNESFSTVSDLGKKFQNNKKQEYIKNWNGRMFLHADNEENPITLAEAFIMPDYEIHKSIEGMGFLKKETLEQVIEMFIEYNRTSTMFITGVPGIGKSSITSWIANRYKDNENVVVLRFRDWKKVILEKTLLEVVCNKLACEEDDLENKILILDGYDEMKALDIREKFLDEFFNDIKDFENFKCIITSRPAYIDTNRFSNVIALKGFDLSKIEEFYRRITRNKLEEKEKIESNLEVLGIPVILYMAIMSKVDISKNPTKPELYNRIFAEKGGIFDKFYDGKVEYGKGKQILRSPDNIKKYLKFLQDTAFLMFDNDTSSLPREKCQIPELEFDRKKITILDFPIKHLFEKTDGNIEFIHKSIYEYFVADYIFVFMREGADLSTEEFAGILGNLLKRSRLSSEILDFLKYKISMDELNSKFPAVRNTFELMLAVGVTYYTDVCNKNVINYEMTVFANMLDILHLWEWDFLKVDSLISHYLTYNRNLGLNLSKLDFSRVNLNETSLKRVDFSGLFLVKANLRGGNLKGAKLRGVDLRDADLREINLKGADLSGADLRRANLKGANLKGTNLNGASLNEAYLRGADLEGAYLRGADLYNTYLRGVNLKETYLRGAYLSKAYLIEAELKEISMEGAILENAVFGENQIKDLEKIYDLSRIMVCFDNTDELISYEKYCDRRKSRYN